MLDDLVCLRILIVHVDMFGNVVNVSAAVRIAAFDLFGVFAIAA